MTGLADRIHQWRTPTRLTYVGILLLATLSPYAFDPNPANVAHRISRAIDLSVTPSDAIDAARNLVLFAGWGIVWLMTAPASRVWKSVRGAFISGVCISFTVEALQLFSSVRYASVLDLVTNSGGSLGGGLFALAFVKAVRSERESRSYVGIPILTFAGTYAIATLAEGFIPLFRQTAYPNVRGGPFGRFQVVIDLFDLGSFWPIPVSDVILFLPLGAYGVAALTERGWSYKSAALAVSTAGTLVFAATEIGHGFLGLPIQLGAFAAHTLGTGLGALLAMVWIPSLTQRVRGRYRPLGLMVLHGVVLCLWAWRPFVLDLDLSTLTDHLSPQWWVPLASLSSRVDMFSVMDVTAEFVLFFPLGSILAVWSLTKTGVLRGFLPGIYLAALTELGQLFVVGRYLDLTDFLIEASGVMVGWLVIRRAGFTPYGSIFKRSVRR